MKRMFRIAVAGLVGALAFAGTKVASDMPRSSRTGLVDVIVQYQSEGASDAAGSLRAFGTVRQQFHAIPAIHMTVPLSMVARLAKEPRVTYVSPDRAITSFLDITTQAVGANQLWASGWDGTGVGVAVIDSGVARKADLSAADGTSRIVYSESFVPGQDASDQFGHGTHVAGIVGANGAASSGPNFTHTFKGVAPNANIINLRVLDANGASQESEVIAAIEEAIALKDTYNIRVINLSLGHPVYESFTLDPLCQAVEAAWRAGITVVTAAGNMGRDNSFSEHGYATIGSPANDPYVITVGAMNTNGTPWRSDDKITSYSSKGPSLLDHIVKPDIVAPGNAVVSLLASPNCTLATQYPSTLISNANLSGERAGNLERLFQAKRDQHGHSGGERRGGADAAAESVADARSDEGAADEDRGQALAALQLVERSSRHEHLCAASPTFSRSGRDISILAPRWRTPTLPISKLYRRLRFTMRPRIR